MTSDLIKPSVVKEILNRHGFSFSKGLGQNFLVDGHALQRIINAAQIAKTDWILEVGPGIGTLTKGLAGLAGRVTAVEIDKSLLPILRETCGHLDNVSIVAGDVLDTDVAGLVPQSSIDDAKVVSNLPYYITSPVIFALLESGVPWRRLVFLVQKEVADRIVASPGSKIYGAPSVTIQSRAAVSIQGVVSSGSFVPRPTVASAILVLEPYRENVFNIKNRNLFEKIVRAAFNQRRKTLVNALANAAIAGMDKTLWIHVVQCCHIDINVRGEQLSVKDYACLANSVK